MRRKFCVTVLSTPAQRYRTDGGEWRKALNAVLSEHTVEYEDIGGGSGGTEAENDYEVVVENELGEHRLMLVLRQAGYNARLWGRS